MKIKTIVAELSRKLSVKLHVLQGLQATQSACEKMDC